MPQPKKKGSGKKSGKGPKKPQGKPQGKPSRPGKSNNNNHKPNQNKNKNKKTQPKRSLIEEKTQERPHQKYQIRGINLISKEDYTKNGQTYPPKKPVRELPEFKNLDFPCAQTMPHPEKKGKFRMESSEHQAIENEMAWQSKIRDMREAAEVHRQTRQAAQQFIKPGMSMTRICEFIESTSSRLVGYDEKQPFSRGWGFPTGCSLNDCAAHYTPNPGDGLKLNAKDLCKIDFGVQINGYIIDCAFSMSFDPMHDELMEAVKAATNRGVEVMGIGARLGEIGAEIQEVMESYECTYDGKVYGVKSIENLNGHSIGPYEIHAGKTVPIVKNEDMTKMEEGELFAIETFGSTGKGIVFNDGDCSHYAVVKEANPGVINGHKGAKDLMKFINKRFGTIPFCRRWLEDEGQKRHLMALRHLVESGVVRAYPPLCDQIGCFTAQYEHTILLKPTCKEVLSRGLDY